MRFVALPVLFMLLVGCGPKAPRVRMVFSLDFDRAIEEKRIPADADREAIAGATLRTVVERLAAHGVEGARVRVLDDSTFVVSLPEGMRDASESVAHIVTMNYELKFRIEVLPTGAYRPWRGDGRKAPRLEEQSTYPWKGTASEFHEFKVEEVRRYNHARDTETAYEPSRPGEYFVLPKAHTDADDVRDFAVLEEPRNARHRFDGSALKNPVAGKDPNSGKPIVLYEVKTAYQGMFGEWTGENVGLPLAIVLNGVYRSAPVINSRLTDSVQITLGTGSWTELEQEAEELTRVLRMGTLEVHPTLVSVD